MMTPTLSERLEEARTLLGTQKNEEAYLALEGLIPEMLRAGMQHALGHHMRALGDIASARQRWAEAAQNFRSAYAFLVAEKDPTADEVLGLHADMLERLHVPYEDVGDAMRHELDYVRLLIDRAVHRAKTTFRHVEGRRFQVKVSDEEYELFREGLYPYSDDSLSIERKIMAARLSLTARRRASREQNIALPLDDLVQRFQLSRVERDLLTSTLAPALDPAFLRAYTRAWADFTVREATVHFLVDLVALNHSERELALDALDADAPLVALRVIHVNGSKDTHPSNLLYRSVSAADRIVNHVRGRIALAASIRGIVQLPHDIQNANLTTTSPGQPRTRSTAADIVVVPEVRDRATRFITRVQQALTRRTVSPETPSLRDALLVLVGPESVGKRSLVEAAILDAKGQVLRVNGERLLADRAILERTREVAREARIRGAWILLELPEEDSSDEKPEQQRERERALSSVLQQLRRAGSPLAITSTTPIRQVTEAPGAKDSETLELRFDPPTPAQQVTLWTNALKERGAYRPQLRPAIERVVARVRLNGGSIYCAATLAIQRAATEGIALEPAHMLNAATEQLSHALHTVAQRIPVTFAWHDLVVPERTEEQLHRIVGWARHRKQVLERWGFNRKLPYGRALSALFAGPPGTGKTMAAGVIARELDMELYQIELSQVVSKWIGETEKNLGRVFSEAGRGNAVLLFDEADSLFSKRTEVRSSVDRYSNLEVNYLLQRMEDFDGVIILTTNNEAAIDQAFRRRIRFKVDFPAPDEAARQGLWRSMFPKEATVEEELPFDELASRFEMSGGDIKNAVLRAAFQAAEDRSPITGEHLLRACFDEYREMGRAIRED